MSASLDPGLLYTALMLRKLHELQGFGRVLDAGAEGRYRAVLAGQLPGAAWTGIEEAWAPLLGEVRLRVRDGRLGCADLRLAAAARSSGVDLALFEDVFEHLEPGDALALADAWTARVPLVLAALPAGAPPPGPPAARFAWAGGAVCLFSADAGRLVQLARLHEPVSGIARRMAGAA